MKCRLFAVALAACAALPAQQLSFTSAILAAGNSPISVRLADFNSDSKLDIVVINTGGWGAVSVLLNAGGGAFSNPITTTTAGLGAMALTSGDFNHDGHPDLAVVNNLSNNVSILLGNGDGTFRIGGYPAVHQGPVAITEGDFNRDGYLDLAVVNSLTGDVTILLGKPGGTFRPGVNVFVGSAPTSIKSGDFNGDGIPDLAVTNGTQGLQLVYLLLGNGDGSFRSGGAVPVGNEPFALVAHDFNHDHKIDLAVANLASNNISVLLGNGDGTFRPAANYPAGAGPVSVKAAPLTGGPNLDLAACAVGSAAIMVFPGRGDGTFSPPLAFPTGALCNSMALGDLDQDGRYDMVAATPTGLVVFTNTGNYTGP